MENQDENASTVHAVETSLAVVNAIQELDEPGITKVAAHLDLPKSTVFNHVKTLEQNNYLVPLRPDGYRLGLKFLEHGIESRENLEIFEASSPAMEQLANETQLAVWLAVEEFGEVVCIRKELGERAVPTRGKIGRRLHMHSSSLGKAILANLPEDRIEQIIDTFGLPVRTERIRLPTKRNF
jgi:DNA-binding IclR family transcriptional regulator